MLQGQDVTTLVGYSGDDCELIVVGKFTIFRPLTAPRSQIDSSPLFSVSAATKSVLGAWVLLCLAAVWLRLANQ